MNSTTDSSVKSCSDGNKNVSDVTKVTTSEGENMSVDEEFNIVICDVRSLSEDTLKSPDSTPDLPHTTIENVDIKDHSLDSSEVFSKTTINNVPESITSQDLPPISSEGSIDTIKSCNSVSKTSTVSLSVNCSETVDAPATLIDTSVIVTSSGLLNVTSDSVNLSNKKTEVTSQDPVSLTSLSSIVASPNTFKSSKAENTHHEPVLTKPSDAALNAVPSASIDSNTLSTLHPVATVPVSLSVTLPTPESTSNNVSESIDSSYLSSTVTTSVSDASVVCSSSVSLSTPDSFSDASHIDLPPDTASTVSQPVLIGPPILTAVQCSTSSLLASDTTTAAVSKSSQPSSPISTISSSDTSVTLSIPSSAASLPLSTSVCSISNDVVKISDDSFPLSSNSLVSTATISSSSGCLSSSSSVTAFTAISVANDKDIPSSNSQIMPLFPPAHEVVKSEPVDDYCTETNAIPLSENQFKFDNKPGFLHKGNKLNAYTPSLTSSNPQKLMLAKVNVVKVTQGSSPSKYLINKTISSKPILLSTDNTAKLNPTASVNVSNPATVLTSNPMPLAQMTPSVIKKSKTSEEISHFDTINIHSVGVPRITDLIARRNPIPVYKPPPLPSDIKFDKEMELHTCHECGDSFRLASSLNVHINRCVMHIKYKCLRCGIVSFANKCQLLSHLRSHLNIEKSQAVPIHIMSDSIEITSSFNDIIPGKPFEWYKTPFEVVTSPTKMSNCNYVSISTGMCGQCDSVFTDKKSLILHFQGADETRFFCSDCPMCLNSSCAMAAHSAFHKLAGMSNKFSEITAEMKELVKSLQCPECGVKFWEHSSKNTSLSKYIQDAVLHIKLECFHLSRLAGFECLKCDTMFSSTNGLENHLLGKVEHYFKCELCPMALKAVKGIHSHFMYKHKNVESSDVKAKVIYRCHICDTLIDDKTFLFQHVSAHVRTHKMNAVMHYHCLFCGEMFSKKEPLQTHTIEKHTQIKRQFTCACKKQFANPLKYMIHVFSLICVSVVKPNIETFFCDRCNIACVGMEALNLHTCLAVKLANVALEVGTKVKKSDKKSEEKQTDTVDIVKKSEKSFEEKQTNTVNGQDHDGITTSRNAWNAESQLPPGMRKHCVWCREKFRSMGHRERHLKSHMSKDKVMTCIYCDYIGAKTYHELKSHEISCLAVLKMQSRKRKEIDDGVQLTSKKVCKKSEAKVVEQFICEKCDSIFPRRKQLEEHEKSEHGFHPCHLCGIVYDSQRSLNKHLSVKHEGKRALFICGICKVFTGKSKEIMIRHIKQKHRVKSSLVSDCIVTSTEKFDETASSESNNVQPSTSASAESPIKKLRVEGEDIFKCAKCQYMSPSKDDFREHILTHKTSETYQCFECGLCFAAFPSLKRHVIIVHKIKNFDRYMEENKIEEPSVSNELEDTVPPVSHVSEEAEDSAESEDDTNNLECKVCYKKFEAIESLHYHVRVHGMAFIRRKSRFKLKKKVKRISNNSEK
ncbi:hypothetical protein ACF0H5_013325 [Mactra antiquata]